MAKYLNMSFHQEKKDQSKSDESTSHCTDNSSSSSPTIKILNMNNPPKKQCKAELRKVAYEVVDDILDTAKAILIIHFDRDVRDLTKREKDKKKT